MTLHSLARKSLSMELNVNVQTMSDDTSCLGILVEARAEEAVL